MEISKHPEMGNIIASIRKICDDMPCDECKDLKDDLNAAKSRMIHWKERYDELKDEITKAVDAIDFADKPFDNLAREFFERVKKIMEQEDN
jgi:predicted  nucleic acid-binding Zn-ribbon protein